MDFFRMPSHEADINIASQSAGCGEFYDPNMIMKARWTEAFQIDELIS